MSDGWVGPHLPRDGLTGRPPVLGSPAMKPTAVPYYASSAITILREIRPLPRVFGLLRRPTSTSVQIPGQKLDFEVRDFMDVWCLKETFLNRDYIVHGFEPKPDWTVIDIGAALGDFSVQCKRDFGVRRVIAVEPAPSANERLKENLHRNGADGVEIVDKALAEKPGELWLDVSGPPLSMGTTATQAHGQQVRVEAITMTMLFDELGIERCDLMKLDCEGAEFELLKNPDDEALARTDRIVMEFHETAGPNGRDRRTLLRTLEQAGFVAEAIENKVHRDLGFLRAVRKELV
jgi:FkbM family methyltransferase